MTAKIKERTDFILYALFYIYSLRLYFLAYIRS